MKSSNARSGITLIEVLMSLMIMSIGVSAVAVLFPISVLRSIQATQLTNAAILKVNAETLLQMRPELVFDPDGDQNYQEHVGRTNELHYIVDPSGYFEMASTMTYSVYPTLSVESPAVPARQPNDQTLRGAADWFGNIDSNNDGVPEPFAYLPRYDGGLRTATITNSTYPNGFRPQGGDPEELRALRSLGATISKLGDGWETIFEGIPEQYVFADGTTGTTAPSSALIAGVMFSADSVISDVPTSSTMVPRVSGTQIIADPEVCRALVFSADGQFSASLTLTFTTTISGQPCVLWTEDTNLNSTPDTGEDLNSNGAVDRRTLSPQFINPQTSNFAIGRVLLQTAKTHDYNWLLTVRRGRDGQARGVDVVITFNKGITADDERLYTANLTAGSFSATMILDGGMKDGGTEPAEPAIRKSGYLLDVQNARWYRIREYTEVKGLTIGTVSGDGYNIVLETPVAQTSPAGKIMFLPGVVDVYPMGSIPIPSNL